MDAAAVHLKYSTERVVRDQPGHPIQKLNLNRIIRIADMSGARMLRGSHGLDPDNPELTGVRLANELRHQGASDIRESGKGLPEEYAQRQQCRSARGELR